MPARTAQCRTHKAAAGWRCTRCNEYLCPDCAGFQRVGPVQLLACTLCGDQAAPLVRHRLEGGTLVDRLPGALLFPFRGQGLLGLGALAVFNALFSYGGVCGSLVAAGITTGSIFAVVRSTGRGAEQLELSDFSDLFADVVMPLVRFGLATLPLWGGALYAFFSGSTLVWTLVGVLSSLWVPMALLAAATSGGVFSLLNPVLMYGLALKLGRDYLVYLAALVFSAALFAVAMVAAHFADKLPVPFLSRVLADAVRLAPVMVAAHVGGLVLYLRGDALGWGTPDQYAEPVLGKVEPRGAVAERDTPASRSPARAAIELPPEASFAGPSGDLSAVFGGPPAPEPRRAAPTSLDPAALPSRSVNDEVSEAGLAVRAAMARGDGAAALAAWEDAGRLVPELTVSELSWLGRSAASKGNAPVALAAFEAAAFSGGGPEVAAVRVMLARLLDERLARPDDALKWMRRVADESPDTDAGRFAQAWLMKRA